MLAKHVSVQVTVKTKSNTILYCSQALPWARLIRHTAKLVPVVMPDQSCHYCWNSFSPVSDHLNFSECKIGTRITSTLQKVVPGNPYSRQCVLTHTWSAQAVVCVCIMHNIPSFNEGNLQKQTHYHLITHTTSARWWQVRVQPTCENTGKSLLHYTQVISLQ